MYFEKVANAFLRYSQWARFAQGCKTFQAGELGPGEQLDERGDEEYPHFTLSHAILEVTNANRTWFRPDQEAAIIFPLQSFKKRIDAAINQFKVLPDVEEPSGITSSPGSTEMKTVPLA